jgi:hypothetical protein
VRGVTKRSRALDRFARDLKKTTWRTGGWVLVGALFVFAAVIVYFVVATRVEADVFQTFLQSVPLVNRFGNRGVHQELAFFDVIEVMGAPLTASAFAPINQTARSHKVLDDIELLAQVHYSAAYQSKWGDTDGSLAMDSILRDVRYGSVCDGSGTTLDSAACESLALGLAKHGLRSVESFIVASYDSLVLETPSAEVYNSTTALARLESDAAVELMNLKRHVLIPAGLFESSLVRDEMTAIVTAHRGRSSTILTIMLLSMVFVLVFIIEPSLKNFERDMSNMYAMLLLVPLEAVEKSRALRTSVVDAAMESKVW